MVLITSQEMVVQVFHLLLLVLLLVGQEVQVVMQVVLVQVMKLQELLIQAIVLVEVTQAIVA